MQFIRNLLGVPSAAFPPGYDPPVAFLDGGPSVSMGGDGGRCADDGLAALAGKYDEQSVLFTLRAIQSGVEASADDALKPLEWLADRLGAWTAREGGSLGDRLVELGFTRDASIRVLRRAPFGGPLQVQIREFILSLRREQARSILVLAQRGTPVPDA